MLGVAKSAGGVDWIGVDSMGFDSTGAKSAEVESMEFGESASALGGVDSTEGDCGVVCSVDSTLGAGGVWGGVEESSEVVLVSVMGEGVAVVRGACGSSGVLWACSGGVVGMGSEGAEAEGMGADGAVESDVGIDGVGADGAEVGAGDSAGVGVAEVIVVESVVGGIVAIESAWGCMVGVGGVDSAVFGVGGVLGVLWVWTILVSMPKSSCTKFLIEE